MTKAIIALGSNMGHSLDTLQKAALVIGEDPKIKLLQGSSLYRTKPVGYLDQDDFINAVIEIETSLSPLELYQKLAQIELDFGRVRLFKDGPRTLDLDVIVCEDMLSDDERILLPHPRAQERAFVLVPLHEICPDLVFPDTKQSVSEALNKLSQEDLDGIIKLDEYKVC